MRRAFIPLFVAMLVLPSFAWALGGETDPTWTVNQGLSSAAITKSDSTILSPATRAIYNGNATACDIALKLQNDSSAVTFSNVQSGQILPVRAKVVMSTSTTCSNMVAIY